MAMLSGEGMQRRRTVKNNNRSNQQKSNFALAAHFFCTFLCRCFARLHVLWSKCRTFPRSLFFTAAHFHLALVAASISHFVTAATKFSCCSSNKKMSPLFFISRSRSLSPFFSLSFAGLPPTFSFSLALYSKFVGITINLSLILQTTRIQKQFPLSVFVFIDSFVVSAL